MNIGSEGKYIIIVWRERGLAFFQLHKESLAVVVGSLAEKLLPIPEDMGSNPTPGAVSNAKVNKKNPGRGLIKDALLC